MSTGTTHFASSGGKAYMPLLGADQIHLLRGWIFSQDFYKLVKSHLEEGGLFLQWMHSYDSSIELIGMVATTLSKEFETLHVFTGQSGDLLFLASMEKIDAADLHRAERRLSQNTAAKESLSALKIRSLDGLLARQTMSDGVLKVSFVDGDVHTHDHPKHHYLAGRDFFMGNVFRPEDLYLMESSFYVGEYLLPKLRPRFTQEPLTEEKLRELIDSLIVKPDPVYPAYLPQKSSLRLLAHLQNPHAFPLTPAEKTRFAVGNLSHVTKAKPYITNVQQDIRKSIEQLLGNVSRTRRWLVRYPLDGLKQLLRYGMVQLKTAEDINWCVLNLSLIMILERNELSDIAPILSRATKDDEGKLILDEKSKDIHLKVKQLMKIFHPAYNLPDRQ